MATGLLYDVHGNLPALEAVLADAARTPVARWVLGGDYASFGAWPVEVIQHMDALDDAVWIRGNWDRWQDGDTHDMAATPALLSAREEVVAALGPELVARLGALPATHRDGDTLFCHGAPNSDMETFLPTSETGDAGLLDGADARLVVFGHSHLAFTRAQGDVTLLNPGSVGLPFDGDVRASWGVLHDDGTIDIRRVDYDVEAAVDGLSRFSGSWVAGGIDRLRTASF